MDDGKCKQATPHGTLLEQIMDSSQAKTEREWAAAREIESLRDKVTMLEGLLALADSDADELKKELAALQGYKAAWVEAQRGRSAAERELSALKVEMMELRAAAIKQQGEPVAWMYVNTDGECEQIEYGKDIPCDGFEPLYTSAPTIQDGYSAGDMADQGAKQFREGYAEAIKSVAPVITWLRAGCDPQDAAKEIELLIDALPITEGEQNAE